mgnify:CR=1 FL=1|tara:strand:- start:567 stop:878 length:312 start_codon:yes stop_codon:yes gene_type:complete
MTIHLYISTSLDVSLTEIASLLSSVECQITQNISITKDHVKEIGFHIILIDFNSIDFKEKVWKPLQKRLKLHCAFVRDEDRYTGCVLNWPGVFVESKCKAQNL